MIWPIDSSDISPNHPEYQKFLKQRHNRPSTRPDYTTYISRKGYQIPQVSPKKLRLLDRTFVVEKSSESADRYLKSDGLQLMATNSKLTDIPENLNDSVESFHTARQNSQVSVLEYFVIFSLFCKSSWAILNWENFHAEEREGFIFLRGLVGYEVLVCSVKVWKGSKGGIGEKLWQDGW